MSTAKRRRLDLDTASNGSGRATSSRRTAGGGASRAGAGAAAAARAVQASIPVNGNGSAVESGPYIPILSLASLPVAALSRYALHYNLIQPEPLTPAQATYPTPPLPLQLSLAPSTQPVFRRRASLIPERKIPENNNKENDEGPDAEAAQSSVATAEGAPVQMELDRPANSSGPSNPTKQNGQAAEASTATNGSRQGSAVAAEVSGASGTTTTQQLKPHYDINAKSRSKYWVDPGEPDAEELRGMSAYDGGEEQFRERIGGLARSHWERNQTVKEGETIINFAYAVRMRSKVLKSVPPP